MSGTDEAFEAAGRQPRAWLDWADIHREVAECIRRKAKRKGIAARAAMTGAVAMMHAQHALENLLKAIIVKRNPTLVDRRGLKKPVDSHDLTKLAKAANVTLTAQEENLVARLTGFVEFAGRYPIPMHASVPGTGYSEHDQARFDALFKRLKPLAQ